MCPLYIAPVHHAQGLGLQSLPVLNGVQGKIIRQERIGLSMTKYKRAAKLEGREKL